MTLFTKQSLTTLVTDLGVSQGVVDNVSSDAVELVNTILDKILETLFPYLSSAVLVQVKQRVSNLGASRDLAKGIFGYIVDVVNQDEAGLSSTGIPQGNIASAIREHIGMSVVVPVDTVNFVDKLLQVVSSYLIGATLEQAEVKDKIRDKKLEARHILQYLYQTEEGRKSHFHNAPTGPLDKVSRVAKKKSRSRKSRSRKSRGSRKRCPPRQISVRSFVRDGIRIKSYCRKKSAKK